MITKNIVGRNTKNTAHRQRRKFLTRSLAIASPILFSPLAGCITNQLLDPSWVSYEEKLSSLLVTQDGKHIVVITEKYHYIFDTSPTLLNLIQSPLHTYAKASFQTLFVDEDNTCKITFDLILKDLPEKLASTAEQIGFQADATGYRAKIDLKGKRYVAGETVVGTRYQLNQEYTVKVSAIESAGAKVLLTPITATADGALILLGSPLLLLLMFSDCTGGSRNFLNFCPFK